MIIHLSAESILVALWGKGFEKALKPTKSRA